MRSTLADLAEAAQAECGGRAVTADKVHVTLFFLGHVERHRIAELKQIAESVHGIPFDLELNVVDYWRHNRVVWLGSRECPHALKLLADALAARLVEAGFENDDRPYVPHVTLLRNAKRAPRSVALTRIGWSVREYVLFESIHGRYDVIARWPMLV